MLPGDARFVLPAPRGAAFDRLHMLGGSSAVAEIIASSGLAHEVSDRLSDRRECDCLLVFAGAGMPLDETLEQLAPGGVLYWEIERGRQSGPIDLHKTTRQLRQAGFRGLQAYWAPFDFGRTPILLPVERPAAARWYLDAMHGVRLPRSSEPALAVLLGTVSRGLIVTAIRQPMAAPTNVVLRRSGVGRSEHRAAILVGGSDMYGRVALLPFSSAAEQPEAAVKVARLPQRNASIAHEQAALLTYRAQLNGQTRSSLPRPLGMSRWGNLMIGAETCARGRLLSADPRRFAFLPARRDLDLVARWVAEFHRQTRTDASGWSELRRRDLVEDRLNEFRATFGDSPGEPELFGELRRLSRSLAEGALPTVCSHWGLTDRNIYVDRGRISVVDWEGGGPGLPLLDLVYFAWHWYRGKQASDDPLVECDAFIRLFVAPRNVDARVAAVRAAIGNYLRALDLAPSLWPRLLALTWVARAVGRRDRARVTGASVDQLRQGNVYAHFVSALARHRDLLLSGRLV